MEFDFRIILRIMEISEGAILDIHNSSYDTQPHLIIVYYCYSENESKVKEKLH